MKARIFFSNQRGNHAYWYNVESSNDMKQWKTVYEASEEEENSGSWINITWFKVRLQVVGACQNTFTFVSLRSFNPLPIHAHASVPTTCLGESFMRNNALIGDSTPCSTSLCNCYSKVSCWLCCHWSQVEGSLGWIATISTCRGYQQQTQLLRAFHVSLSKWHASYGTCACVYHQWYAATLPTYEWIQCKTLFQHCQLDLCIITRLDRCFIQWVGMLLDYQLKTLLLNEEYILLNGLSRTLMLWRSKWRCCHWISIGQG